VGKRNWASRSRIRDSGGGEHCPFGLCLHITEAISLYALILQGDCLAISNIYFIGKVHSPHYTHDSRPHVAETLYQTIYDPPHVIGETKPELLSFSGRVVSGDIEGMRILIYLHENLGVILASESVVNERI
jgi:hypothetical protein